ncbi:MAG: ROK family protein [Spirochaetales bacterium]|nr:ROK family protein [Spirochaetales bacterium]
MQREKRIGIDLGGTKIEAVVLDCDGKILLRERRPTPPPMHQAKDRYQAILEAIAALLKEATAVAGPDAPVGMGIPGSLRPGSGLVQNANTTELIGQPLGRDLRELTGHEIVIANDANCFALAEALSGAGRGYNLVFGIIMGTGCGGGLVIGGQVRDGPHSIAGEWGHMSIDPAGRKCYCGNVGCIETKISGGALQKIYQEQTNEAIGVAELRKRALGGEKAALFIWEQFLEDFGRAVGGLISILDPDCLVLGGGLSQIPELYTTGLEKIHRYSFSIDLKTPLLANHLGDSAGVIGAAWLGRL